MEKTELRTVSRGSVNTDSNKWLVGHIVPFPSRVNFKKEEQLLRVGVEVGEQSEEFICAHME